MRKLLVLVVAVVALGFVFGQEAQQPKFSVGLDMPTFAWVKSNANGEIQSLFGINLGLGVTYRSYLTPLAIESGSIYWEAGTILLIDPYIGGGYDYRINEMLYVGGGLDIYPLNAFLGWGYGLFTAFIPNLHLGVYIF